MNSLKLVLLKIDDTSIRFKDGLNYVVGMNGSGKTVIFNCIKYVLGLNKSISCKGVGKIELHISINEHLFQYTREVGNSSLFVSHSGKTYCFRPRSKELDIFLQDNLVPGYIFEGDTESALQLLDFCFLSEERSANRRQQWEAMNSICGINVSLLSSFEKDIYALKKEVSKNKELKNIVDEFARSLSINLNENTQFSGLDEDIEITKVEFFSKFREKEELLINATLKFEEMKNRSDSELKRKMAEIEDAFVDLYGRAGFDSNFFGRLESFIKDRNIRMSYGEVTVSRFILVLAIAQITHEGLYNFPQIIINDSYLSHDLNNGSKGKIANILDDVVFRNKDLQYVEFTYRNDIPKEYVVLNLSEQGGWHVFKN